MNYKLVTVCCRAEPEGPVTEHPARMAEAKCSKCKLFVELYRKPAEVSAEYVSTCCNAAPKEGSRFTLVQTLTHSAEGACSKCGQFAPFFKKEHLEKPPLGLKPRFLHDEDRREEILAAMLRYAKAGKAVEPCWVQELSDLERRLVRTLQHHRMVCRKRDDFGSGAKCECEAIKNWGSL